MAKPARKPAPDHTEEVFRSAAPGASQESVDELLKSLKRRAPGAPPPKLAVAEKSPPTPSPTPSPTPKAELPKPVFSKVDAILHPETPKDVARSAVVKAKEQDKRARDSQQRLKVPKRSKWVQAGLGVGLLIVAGLGLDLYLTQPQPVPRTDYSADVADVLPLTELHDHGGEWVGIVDSSWVGVSDPTIAREACNEVRRRALIPAGLSLYTTSGQNLVVCGL